MSADTTNPGALPRASGLWRSQGGVRASGPRCQTPPRRRSLPSSGRPSDRAALANAGTRAALRPAGPIGQNGLHDIPPSTAPPTDSGRCHPDVPRCRLRFAGRGGGLDIRATLRDPRGQPGCVSRPVTGQLARRVAGCFPRPVTGCLPGPVAGSEPRSVARRRSESTRFTRHKPGPWRERLRPRGDC
jgi:hypothetical protein